MRNMQEGSALFAAWVCSLVLAFATPGEARELSVNPEELVEVELAALGVSPVTGTPVVLLRDLESGDVVPIFIGVAEARAILLAMHGEEPPRPMTHDLIGNLLSAVGATLERVMIDDLANDTYFGMLELKLKGHDELVRVDTRPSDGLALAVRTGATILVAPKILIATRDLKYEGLDSDQVVTALGITVVEVTDELRSAHHLPKRRGVLVHRVTGRAARAGLNPGSLILKVNNKVPESPMAFLELVRQTPEGQRVRIHYWQDGEEKELSLPALRRERPRDEPPKIRI